MTMLRKNWGLLICLVALCGWSVSGCTGPTAGGGGSNGDNVGDNGDDGDSGNQDGAGDGNGGDDGSGGGADDGSDGSADGDGGGDDGGAGDGPGTDDGGDDGNLPDDSGGVPVGGVITTVAGDGIAGFNGDGLDPNDTALYLPQDISFGPNNTLFLVDWNNHRIRTIGLDSSGVCNTVAGTGELGDAQDGPALDAQFNHPTNVTFDQQGRLVMAAWHNSKVKRLDLQTGLIENLAGTGGRSFNGNGMPGNETLLDLPSSVGILSDGSIAFSDQANFMIRVLLPQADDTFVVETIAGTGEAGYGGDGGPAADAQLSSPKGQSAPPAGRLVVDHRDFIWFADTGNHIVRVIDTTGTIHLVAGTPESAGFAGDGGPATSAMLNTPSDVHITADGVLYIADTMNHAIRRVIFSDPTDFSSGTIETVAGIGGMRGYDGDGGLATEALLDRPYGVAVDPETGDVYIADTHNQRVRRITQNLPDDFDPDADNGPADVEQVPCTDVVGSICTYAGTGQFGFNGDGHDRLQTSFYWPFDIEFGENGRVIVQDWNNHKVREILPDDTFTTIMGTDFIGDGPPNQEDLTRPGADPLTIDLNHPTDAHFFSNGDILEICWHNHKMRELNADTGEAFVLGGRGATFAGDNGPVKDALFNQLNRGAFDSVGNFYLVDQRNQRIRVILNFDQEREDAIVFTVVGTGEKGFNGDGAGLETQLAFQAGGNPEPSGALAIDADDNVVIADSDNHLIRRIEFGTNEDGTRNFDDVTVTTIAGQAGSAGFTGDGGPAIDAHLNKPEDMEFGPDGNLYFADTDNNVVRMINMTDMTISTVAGTGANGYSGDGGPATDAQLNRPFGVAFDLNGDLYISDSFNSRIRKVKLTE